MDTTPEIRTSTRSTWGDSQDPAPQSPEAPAHKLDSDDAVLMHEKLCDWFDSEWDRQATNRYQQALDEDFYDGLQWSEEDAAALIERGQAPLVFNEIKPTIDWIIGTERRTRTDFKILPRESDDVSMAETKTKLMKYVGDVNKSQWHKSAAFADAIKSGVGWMEVGIRGDSEDEPLYFRNENWRNTLYDSHSTERDYSDARYFFRWKYIDKDIALTIFPERKDIIEQSTVSGAGVDGADDPDSWYMNARVTPGGEDYSNVGAQRYAGYGSSSTSSGSRERVKIMECWYKIPAVIPTLRGHRGLQGRPYDPQDPAHANAVSSGAASVYDRITMQVRVALFTDMGLLDERPSPYHHNKIPFVPVWCFRRKRDNAPYGCIRQVRDAQEDLNKRGSKALYILSTNQVIMDKGAVDDVEELRQEVARPDAIIVKNMGKNLEINRDVQLAHEHMALMDRDAINIRQISGVTEENLGRSTNATSGKAILARQDQGGTVTTEIFDNLRLAYQLAGEMQLSLIEQYYTAPKVIRLTNARGVSTWDQINSVDPETGAPINPITASQADFIVSEQDFRSSLRQAMFESLFDVTTKLAAMNPQIALNMLDLVIDMADLPNKDELVKRIRQMNGMRDPDQQLTPEEQQMMAQQQQEQAKAKAMADEAQQLLLQEQAAKVEKLKADAAAILAGIQRERDALALKKQELEMSPDGEMQQIHQQASEAVATAQQEAQAKIEEADNAIRAAEDRARSMQAQIDKMQAAVASQTHASESSVEVAKVAAEAEKYKADKELEAAKLEAKAKSAENDTVISGLTSEVTKLKSMLEKIQADAIKQREADLKKEADEATSEATALKQQPSDIKSSSAPQQPVIVNLTVEAAKPTTRTISITKDANGNLTGASTPEGEKAKPSTSPKPKEKK